MNYSQPFPAMLTIVGFEVSLLVASRTATVSALLLRLVNHCGRDDTRRNSDDGVTKNHDKRGQELAQTRNRRYVAIANSGERHDSPIDARRDILELRVWKITLYHEHESADDRNQYQYKEEVHAYLRHALLNGKEQEIPLIDKSKQLENPEYTDKSERTHQSHVA